MTATIELPTDGQFRFLATPCPVCGSEAFRALGFRGGTSHPRGLGVRTRIVACRICSHRYPHPMPQITDLSRLYGEPTEYFKEHNVEAKLEARRSTIQLLENLRAGETGALLDIGAGCGELVQAARERGWQAVGVEPVRAFVDEARRRGNCDVRHGLFSSTEWTAGSFDAVVLAAVLEHVDRPKELLLGIHRVLKPGGLLFLDIPNEGSLPFRLGNLYYRLRGRDWVVNLAPTFSPFHLQGFTRRSIKRLLCDTGFHIAWSRTLAGTLCDHRSGLLPGLERMGFAVAAKLAAFAKDGVYIELVARAV